MRTAENFATSYHGLIRKDIFPLFKGTARRLLDLGGGIGATSAALKEAGLVGRVTVVDLVAGNALPNIDASYAGSLEDMSFLTQVIEEEGPFDAILCLDLLEHLREPWEIITVLREALQPNGMIIASIPNVRHLRVVWPLVVNGSFQLADKGLLDRTHLRWFTRSGAVSLMTPPGLELEEIRGKLPQKRIYRIANFLSFGSIRGFLDIQYLIRVRRVK